LRTSRDAWNHGDRCIRSQGTTSMKTVETRSYDKKLFLRSNSPNFWVAPRIYRVIYQVWVVEHRPVLREPPHPQ
jgi:hypothetical protein